MCEYCTKHGEGKKWYLRAENYSDDLMSDLRRRRFIEGFFGHPDKLEAKMGSVTSLKRLPAFLQAVMKPILIRQEKKTHYGQVLPIEDVEEILGFVSSVTRFSCICRHINVGTEQRYCYGLSLLPAADSQYFQLLRSIDAEYLNGPDTSGLEAIPKEEALDQMRNLDREGVFHSIWTLLAPCTATLCNCDMDCLAFKATTVQDFPVMFRAEYVADVDPDRCTGCRACMTGCSFAAIRYRLAHKKVDIDPTACYGCGVCRAQCHKDAIVMKDRSSVPLAANIW